MSIIRLQERIQRGMNLKESIKGMSYENLVKLAEEDPLIPVEETKSALADNVGHSATIQNYCTLVNTQPEMQLDEVPDIAPSQNRARCNASYWLGTLSRRARAISTQVEAFANDYGSLDEGDIDDLLADINTSDGKEAFRQVMYWFRDSASHFHRESVELSTSLSTFSHGFYEDLRDFQIIKQDVDAKYGSSNGKIPMLEADMILLEEAIRQLNIGIGFAAIALSVGIMSIVLAPLVFIASPIGGSVLLVTGVVGIVGGGVGLGQLIQQRKEAQDTYQSTAEELKTAQLQCAALHVLSDNFGSLIEGNAAAGLALLAMIQAWQVISNRFSGIADSVQGAVDQEMEFLIRLKLRAALKDTADLKTFADLCIANGILDVVPPEELVHRLRLPRSWIGRPINGEVFNAFVTSSRDLGRYDKGRRGWESRDRQFICS